MAPANPPLPVPQVPTSTPQPSLWSRQSGSLKQGIKTVLKSEELDPAIHALDTDLARLREERATSPLALDRMLPFWALVFNLREVSQDLTRLASLLPELA